MNKKNLAISLNSFSILSCSTLNRFEQQVRALTGQHRVLALSLTGDRAGGMLHRDSMAETWGSWHRRKQMPWDCFLAEQVRLYP